jgi:hypothetical protein
MSICAMHYLQSWRTWIWDPFWRLMKAAQKGTRRAANHSRLLPCTRLIVGAFGRGVPPKHRLGAGVSPARAGRDQGPIGPDRSAAEHVPPLQ